MIKDRSERRAYRRSPGRQYDYDPLQGLNDNRTGQSGRFDSSPLGERRSTQLATSASAPTTTGLLGPRPDPRRARQLLRQNILASKSRTTTGLLERAPQRIERHSDQLVPFENVNGDVEPEDDPTLFSNRRARNNRSIQRHTPVRERYPDVDEDVEEEQWDEQELEYLDPDLGYEYEEEDPLDRRVAAGSTGRAKSPAPRTSGLDARRTSELD